MIGLEVAGYTALSGTTKVLLDTITLPAWVRSIVAIKVSTALITPSVDIPVVTAAYLESDDFNVAPFEVLAAPMLAGDATNIPVYSPKTETYPVNAAVNGGDSIRIYGKALISNTVEPEMAVTLILSSEPPAFTQKHSKLGTLTATGTTADTDVSGTAFTFTAAHRIVELSGVVVNAAVVVSKAFAGYLKFESSEFAAPTPLKLLFEPVQGIIGTGSPTVSGVSRAPVDVSVRSPTTIQDYAHFSLISSTAGSFVVAVTYE